MLAPRPIPIFDGHNDVLLRLYKRASADAVGAFLQGEEKGQLDLAKAHRGGFAGGLFAMFVPSPRRNNNAPASAPADGSATTPAADVTADPSPPGVELNEAQRTVFSMLSLLYRIAKQSDGRVR